MISNLGKVVATMDERDKYLIDLLNKILSQLSQPLTSEKKQSGWDEEAKRSWLEIMERYLTKLQSGVFKENQETEITLIRDLDFFGVLNVKVKCELVDLILQFGEKWNEKYAEKPAWWWKRKEGKLGKIEDPPRKNFK